MTMRPKIISIFGSSKARPGDASYRGALRLGQALARAGFVVCNGGYAGLMEARARGAKEAGGKTFGIPTRQFKGGRCNPWIDRASVAKNWKERLFKLIEAGDGYVVCDGGTGTLVEFACVWEMLKKGLMPSKPVVIFGKDWKRVIRALYRVPEIGRDARLYFASTPAQVVRLLERNL